MSNESPPGPSFSGLLIALVSLLGLAGIVLLGYTVYSFTREGETPAPTPTLAPTAIGQLSFPTRTPVPSQAPATLPPPPTDTPVPAATEPPAATLEIKTAANVRSGPGTNYPILGGLQVGQTAPVLGRDASGQWYAIAYGTGQGWVLADLAAFSGDPSGLPVMAASPPPPPPAATSTSKPPTPANTSAPTAIPPTATSSVFNSRGIVGDSFSVENTTVAVNQDIWFNFKVTNTSDSSVSYGVLAARTESGINAQSWSNETMQPHAVLDWRDHLNIPSAGSYRVYLGICYGTKEACLANQAPWDRLSNSITVIVQ